MSRREKHLIIALICFALAATFATCATQAKALEPSNVIRFAYERIDPGKEMSFYYDSASEMPAAITLWCSNLSKSTQHFPATPCDTTIKLRIDFEYIHIINSGVSPMWVQAIVFP